MSVDQVVFLSRDRVPTTEQWQAAIDAAMLPVKLDATCEAASQSGYWPATYDGTSSGFEFFASNAMKPPLKLTQVSSTVATVLPTSSPGQT